MQFLQAGLYCGLLMVSQNSVDFFTKEDLSQVRNYKWLICQFSGQPCDRVSGVSGRISVCLLYGQKEVIMMEKVATQKIESYKQDCKMR